MTAQQPAPASNTLHITLQILSIVFYTFIAFLCIGLPIAVLPGYVHDQLGFGAVIAGVTIGLQYLATLLSRPFAGRVADTLGGKQAIRFGLLGIAGCGVLTLLSAWTLTLPLLSLALLLGGRLLLGVAQGLIGVATLSWGISQVGPEHTARVISWNGIASYGAIAIGAPMGVLAVDGLDFSVLGPALLVLATVALLVLRKRPDVVVVRGERLPFWSAFGRVAPCGLGLTLASIGYGTLTTFVTLYYLERGWAGAAWCLSAFGVCFIISRLLFVNAVNRFGGYNVAVACMATEVLGLSLLWLAPSPPWALVGAGLTGFGLSLVYPALGVEAIRQVPSSSRGAGLGAYAVFFDMALAIAGPVMGAVAVHLGYASIFCVAALLALVGVGLTLLLARRARHS
ncbi:MULTISPECIES: MFS transporter [unclassified Pseudomonas]|uniref:MFS transporter n=1 Tax=unclassified Pseudomonas TaxID=196821 RepID=UPI001AE8CEB4|nr:MULTISPECIES: MFS transporter [unclassified Pseudomonas]MBP2271699.1 MFS family permease [Pseudomonas sp. BP6]MBP2289330.1 MFS family permease [Pseudomonas sp. BP7]HDS1694889.1 MFS transporter [Pseudomonas putida]HDS1700059.1 MFS transporter [Pseudomonas putida]